MNTNNVLAKLDVLRCRQLGQMLVTDEAREYASDPAGSLVDISRLDGRALLDRFRVYHSRYGTTPFDPEGERFRLYGGAVTIWTGFSGSGKTTLLRQLICHLLHRGSSVFLASLEEDPHDAIVRIAATAAGTIPERLTDHQMQWFIDAYAMRFRLWGKIGIAEHRTLLAVSRRLAHDDRIRHVIIDSMMMMDIAKDDLEGQRLFANRIAATAKLANQHIHLVAHPRKVVSNDQALGLNDVAGVQELIGVVDNVAIIRRASGESESPTAASTPMRISIHKQRDYFGWRGDITGWFHRDLRQFHVEQFPTGAMHYLPEDAFVTYPKALA